MFKQTTLLAWGLILMSLLCTPIYSQVDTLKSKVFQSLIYTQSSGIDTLPPLVLIHGLGSEAHHDWDSLSPYLEKHHRVIQFDLPGFGQSTPSSQQLTPQSLADLTLEVVKHYQLDQFQLIGHSLGGAVALQYAASYPQGLTHLYLIDAAGILQRTAFTKKIAHLDGDHPLQDIASGVMEKFSFMAKAIDYVDDNEDLREKVMAKKSHLQAAHGLITTNLGPAIHQLKVPTTIIWGQEDKIAPLRVAKLLKYALATPPLYIIPDAGHVPISSHASIVASILQGSSTITPTQMKALQAQASNTRVYRCQDQSGVKLKGVYQLIELEHCNVEMKDVQVGQLKIQDSKVKGENILILGQSGPSLIEESVVEFTQLQLYLGHPVQISGSRLDWAGGAIHGDLDQVKIQASSKLIFSVLNSYQASQSFILHLDQDLKETSLKKLTP